MIAKTDVKINKGEAFLMVYSIFQKTTHEINCDDFLVSIILFTYAFLLLHLTYSN